MKVSTPPHHSPLHVGDDPLTIAWLVFMEYNHHNYHTLSRMNSEVIDVPKDYS